MIDVEIIVHEGRKRAVVIRGLESEKAGLVMTPATYDQLRPHLVRKYGEFPEREEPPSAELLALVEVVKKKVLEEGTSPNGD